MVSHNHLCATCGWIIELLSSFLSFVLILLVSNYWHRFCFFLIIITTAKGLLLLAHCIWNLAWWCWIGLLIRRWIDILVGAHSVLHVVSHLLDRLRLIRLLGHHPESIPLIKYILLGLRLWLGLSLNLTFSLLELFIRIWVTIILHTIILKQSLHVVWVIWILTDIYFNRPRWRRISLWLAIHISFI